MSQDAATDREPAGTIPESDVRSILELVRGNAVELLSALENPPSALRIHAGGVVVEAEWQAASTATPPSPIPGPGANGTTNGGPAPVALAPQAVADGEPVPDPAPRRALRAPAVGVFFRAPEPGAKPFVDVGERVTVGRQVAIVEIMKLMVPVHADVDATIVEVLKEDGEHVEYDEPLFAVSTTE